MSDKGGSMTLKKLSSHLLKSSRSLIVNYFFYVQSWVAKSLKIRMFPQIYNKENESAARRDKRPIQKAHRCRGSTTGQTEQQGQSTTRRHRRQTQKRLRTDRWTTDIEMGWENRYRRVGEDQRMENRDRETCR